MLTISELATRSGTAPSALRYYEKLGLIGAERTAGNQRRYARHMLRRVAFIKAGRQLGLSLRELQTALDRLPADKAPTRADWSKVATLWQARIQQRITELERMASTLNSCIGCGCLSLQRCSISNPADTARAGGPGAAYLPAGLRRDDSRLASAR